MSVRLLDHFCTEARAGLAFTLLLPGSLWCGGIRSKVGLDDLGVVFQP